MSKSNAERSIDQNDNEQKRKRKRNYEDEPHRKKQRTIDVIYNYLTASNIELLVNGYTRLQMRNLSVFRRIFPTALSSLICHYCACMQVFEWTIDDPYKYEYKSKPFTSGNIVFQSFFTRSLSSDDGYSTKRTEGNFYTQIVSMPDSVRSCVVYYEYIINNLHTFCSRYAFNTVSKRAPLPLYFFRRMTDKINSGQSLNIRIKMEPIRIHHWSCYKMKDYQQQIEMKEIVKYEWQIDARIFQHQNREYLQSDIFGDCWCLDWIGDCRRLSLRLLKIPAMISRIKVQCSGNANGAIFRRVLEFGMSNEKVCLKMDYPRGSAIGIIVFDVKVEIIELYAINAADDFDMNEEFITRDKWAQYGITQ